MFAGSASRGKTVGISRQPHRRRNGFQARFEPLECRTLLSAVSGDFNHDGVADLAIGVPNQTVNGISNAGAVQILYGAHYAGQSKIRLTTPVNQQLTKSGAAVGDLFGTSLAVGDFNGDGFADLVVGVPGQTVNGAGGAGAVYIYFGSKTGLKTTGFQVWTQDSTNILGVAEAGDHFGSALAVGDFNGDRFSDLAIGAPNEDVGSTVNAGAINVIYGARGGLKAVGNQLFHQGLAGIVGGLGANNLYGAALAVGDFNADGFQDLAIGAPGQTVASVANAGGVNVLYGARTRLQIPNNQFWTVNSTGMQGNLNADARFGAALAAGDFNGDSRLDLAIGAPGEDIATSGPAVTAGAVHVLFGSSSRLTITNNQLWNGRSAGITTASASGDGFGSALVAGQFNSDHVADLAIGIPNKDISVTDQGAVRQLFGARSTGLSTINSQFWSRENNLLGISIPDTDVTALNDHMGSSLASGDFNGDGVSDLAIGVPHDDGTVAAAGDSILIFNQANSTVPLGVKMANGIQYQILTNGTGAQPTISSSVVVNYVGTLVNGFVFDSSAMHGGPQSFNVGGVIEGFGISLLGMRVGSEWRVYIPSELAYGAAGSTLVGPNEALIFDVELLSTN